MKRFLFFSFVILQPLLSVAQDSIAVKKPSPRMQENMPTRRGRGTAKPMPSPQYYRSKPSPRPALPKDSVIKGFNKRDTV
ncbi:hypothetical protein [Fibrella aquatilis]|uniref:Uncharacterized protein n=1 Tax=Fibrella aquatilis TaxID=2817059 RepID=A0A939GAR0_9BACT|nr:hypothetical protein [Fibrella aquatilis]MBO0933794.1 hypothetical protein [Fibrella aquatilis]